MTRNFIVSEKGAMDKVSDVHDSDFERRVLLQIATDVQIFVQNNFHNRDCPACGSEEREPKYESQGFHFNRCTSCGTLYLYPCPSEAQILDFLSTSKGFRMWREDMPDRVRASRQRMYQDRAEFLVSLFPGGRVESVLDVGAGNGEMAACLRPFGTRYVAIEPQPLPFAIPDAEIIAGSFADAVVSAPVDIVCAFEVIEHIVDPYAFLAFARRALKPGGRLVLTTPNGEGFEIEALGSISDAVRFDHVTLYNPRSLTLMLERAGFRSPEISTPGRFDVEIVARAFNEGRIALSKDVRDQLDDPEFQRRLVVKNKSAHMRAVARIS